MSQIFKNLLPYWKSVIIIVLLLIVQSYCDLSLPQYTSNIIDVGIQNEGLEHIVPEAITKEEYNNVMLFMKEEEKTKWQDAFEEQSDRYVRKELTEQELEVLDCDLLEAVLIDYQMEAVEAEQFKENLWNNEQIQQGLVHQSFTKEAFMNASVEEIAHLLQLPVESFEKVKEENGVETKVECVDMRSVFKAMAETGAMDENAVETVRESFQKMSDTLGESTLQSMGIAWAGERAEQAGVDVDQIQTDYLWSSGIKMLGMALLMALATVLVSLVSSRVGSFIAKDLRHKIFHKIVGFSNGEMNQFSTASLITRSTNDIQQIQMVTTMMLRMVLYAPIIGIGGVIKVIDTGAGMGWIIVLAVVLIMAFVLLLMSLALPRFKIMQKLIDRINLVSREILTGLSVIRAFGRENEEEERFETANTDLMKTQLFTNRVMTFMMPGMMTIMYAINVLIIWVAAHKIDDGSMQVGAMTAFITYAMQIVMSFLVLTMMSIMLPRAGVAADRIQEVLKTNSSILDAKEPDKLQAKQGVLRFEHVGFIYPDAKEEVLTDIDFVAEPGKTTAIIGSTGCGKSTLVNLIPRLYDVTSGRITLDGQDIRNVKMHDLREKVGFVPQKGVLFSGTIESNLQFGKADASKQELEEAAEIAQAMEFISEKDKKFKSHIAQGGSNVSGGQKQRLAIARAIVKNPKIYVFDDSFSALDMKTDAKLRKALAGKIKDSTMIIVAQRISTILQADQILVLDEGKIVGRGTHSELLASCEVYQQIAKSQLSEKELGISETGKEE